MTKKKSTKNWLKKHTKDKYVKMSLASRYRSRAFHKLQEIDEKYKVIKSANNIIDLGASPGSWSEYISRNYRHKKVIAVDQTVMEPIEGVKFIHGDINNSEHRDKIRQIITNADLVLSDIAPNISGVSFIDTANMNSLLEIEISIVDKFLQIGGKYLCKCFEGDSLNFLVENLKDRFKFVKRLKPEASRSISRELYVLGIEKI